MNIYIRLALIMSVLISGPGMSQTRTNFEIELPQTKITSSLYHRLVFIDSRSDTSSLGFVQVGILNQKATVVALKPLNKQFLNLFGNLVESAAQEGIIVLQLCQLQFAETTMATREIGECTFRARLYEYDGLKYKSIKSLDTIITVTGMEVTKRLYKIASSVITDYLARNLQQSASSNIAYNEKEIVKIDSIERSKMRMFSQSSLTDGYYNDYQSFRNQTPDYVNVNVVNKNGILSYQLTDSNTGKTIEPAKAYALVHNGKPYILTSQGIYALRREGAEFCFTGKVIAGLDSGVALASMFGIAGVLAHGLSTNKLTSNGTTYYDQKLDPFTGAFIPVRQLSREELRIKKKNGELPGKAFKDDLYQ